MSVYSSSKAAVRSFARTFTTDLKDRKIRVDAISPDVIPSPGYRNSLGMTAEQVKQYADSAVSKIPLGRTGTLDEATSPGEIKDLRELSSAASLIPRSKPYRPIFDL